MHEASLLLCYNKSKSNPQLQKALEFNVQYHYVSLWIIISDVVSN